MASVPEQIETPKIHNPNTGIPEDHLWNEGPFYASMGQNVYGDDALTTRFLAEIVARRMNTDDIETIVIAIQAYFASARAIILSGLEAKFPMGIGLQLSEKYDTHTTWDKNGDSVPVVVRYLQVRNAVYGKLRDRLKVKPKVDYDTYKALVKEGSGFCGTMRKPRLPKTVGDRDQYSLRILTKRQRAIEIAIARRHNNNQKKQADTDTQRSSSSIAESGDLSLLCVPPTTD